MPHSRRLVAMLLASLPIAAAGQAAPADQAGQAPQPAASAAPAPAADAAPIAAAEPSTEIALTPYLWVIGLDGSSSARGIDVDIHQSFGDILKSSDTLFGFMGALDIVHDRLVFQVNGTYTTADFSINNGIARSGPAGVGASVSASGTINFENALVEAMAGYRIVQERFGEGNANRISVDAFGGLRYTSMELDQAINAVASITLPDGTALSAGVVRDVGAREDWLEPLVGLRAKLNIGDNWEIFARGDIGGFGVDNSEFSWQVVAGAGYSWHLETMTLTLFGGYRAVGQDYADDNFAWDAVTHGPILGLSSRWEF